MIEAWGELNVTETFAEGARTFADLVRRIPPGRWDGPGLGEWDLRSLVGHTSRSLITVETYLGQPAELVDALVARVPALVETAGNPLITTAAGGMRLEAYLPTRSFELVVHSLDIAAAVPDIEGPEFSDQLLSQVARVAATAAVLLGRGVEMMLALTGRATLSPGFSVV